MSTPSAPYISRLRRYRVPAVLMLVSHLGACTKWTTYDAAPGAVIETQRPNRVRVTTVDGASRDLDRPTVEGDSVVYYVRTRDLSTGERVRVRGEPLSVDDIAALEVPSINRTHTAALIGGLLGAAFFLYKSARDPWS